MTDVTARSNGALSRVHCDLVPGAGIEPAPPEEEGGLSPPCLPIPPPGRVTCSGYSRLARRTVGRETKGPGI